MPPLLTRQQGKVRTPRATTHKVATRPVALPPWPECQLEETYICRKLRNDGLRREEERRVRLPTTTGTVLLPRQTESREYLKPKSSNCFNKWKYRFMARCVALLRVHAWLARGIVLDARRAGAACMLVGLALLERVGTSMRTLCVDRASSPALRPFCQSPLHSSLT